MDPLQSRLTPHEPLHCTPVKTFGWQMRFPISTDILTVSPGDLYKPSAPWGPGVLFKRWFKSSCKHCKGFSQPIRPNISGLSWWLMVHWRRLGSQKLQTFCTRTTNPTFWNSLVQKPVYLPFMISSYAESFQSQLANQWQVVWELGHDDVHGKTRRHAGLPNGGSKTTSKAGKPSYNLLWNKISFGEVGLRHFETHLACWNNGCRC